MVRKIHQSAKFNQFWAFNKELSARLHDDDDSNTAYLFAMQNGEKRKTAAVKIKVNLKLMVVVLSNVESDNTRTPRRI